MDIVRLKRLIERLDVLEKLIRNTFDAWVTNEVTLAKRHLADGVDIQGLFALTSVATTLFLRGLRKSSIDALVDAYNAKLPPDFGYVVAKRQDDERNWHLIWTPRPPHN